MRVRTGVAALAVVVLLGATVVVGLGFAPGGGGLSVVWVSDTPRDNVRNHHAVGVGPADELVVAPVTAVPGEDVEMTDRSCALVRLSPANGSVVWRAGTPASSCFSHALTEPAIADLDGDGRREVLSASTEGALVAYDGRSGVEEWRVPLSSYGYGRPTIARLPSGSGDAETGVVVSDIDGTVVVADGDGTVRWRRSIATVFDENGTVTDRPVVADLDGDDAPEIVVGSNRGVVVFDADGSERWHRDGPATYVATVPAPGSGSLVVTASYDGVRAFEGGTGRPVWERPLTSSRFRAAGDADGDGTPELYLGRVGGEVRAVDAHTGETEWSTTIAVEDVIVSPPVTADLSGDGRRAVIAPTETGRVVVLDPDTGAELAAYERPVPIWTFVTPADVDGDGAAEILVRYGDGRVVALEYTAAGRPLSTAG